MSNIDSDIDMDQALEAQLLRCKEILIKKVLKQGASKRRKDSVELFLIGQGTAGFQEQNMKDGDVYRT